MKQRTIRKPLRRLGILALVLVMLLNSGVIARAENVVGTVYNYEELTEAIASAKSGDVIEIDSSIVIPKGATLGESGKYVIIRRKSNTAKIVAYYGSGVTTTIQGITFDGNERNAGGMAPMLTIEGNAVILECNFVSCVNGSSSGKGGAMLITGNGEVYIGACNFYDGNAGMGAHIYNESSQLLTIEDSYFTNGWGDLRGGSIYCSTNASSLSLKNVVIKGNHSVQGGGIYTNGSLSIEDSIVYQNEASTQGADILVLGAYSNTTTEEQYNFFLNGTGLYYSEWADDINPSVGCSGQALRFVTTDTPPITDEPTEPSEGGDDEPTDPSGEGGSESGENPSEPSSGDDTGDNPTEGGEGSDSPSEGGESGSEDTNPTEPQDNPSEPATEPSESSGEGSEGGSNVDSHDVTDSHNTEGSNNTTDSHDTTITDTHTEDSHDTEGSYNTDNHSTVDNSSQDTTITDNSDHSTTTENSGNSSTVTDSHDDNSTANNTTVIDSSQADSHTENSNNTSNVSNIDNSSEDRSTTDNSSYRSTHTEDNSYRDNSSTYNYYYDPHGGGAAQGVQIVEIPKYVPVESSGASQPVSVNVPVEVNIPEGYSGSTGATEPSQGVQAPAQNIRIEAAGVDVIYEYTAEGVSISIKAPEAATEPSEPQIAQLASYSTLTEPEPQSGAREPNWVEIVSMCLLAVLVLGELKDLLRKRES